MLNIELKDSPLIAFNLPLTWDRAAVAEKFTKTYANQKISASVGYSAQTGRKGEQ